MDGLVNGAESTGLGKACQWKGWNWKAAGQQILLTKKSIRNFPMEF